VVAAVASGTVYCLWQYTVPDAMLVAVLVVVQYSRHCQYRYELCSHYQLVHTEHLMLGTRMHAIAC